MENDKVQQKRNHQWLTVGSHMEPLSKKQAKEGLGENEVESRAISQLEVPLVSIEQDPCAKNEMETEACGKMQPTEALNQSESELSVQEPVKDSLLETEVCERTQTTDPLNDILTHSCTKKKVKQEASNDDICSKVSNPNVSHCDNSSSFQTINSQPDGKLITKDQVVCGEVPKHTTTSGIRKITFKFSKWKDDCDSQLSASATKCMGNTYTNGTRKVPKLTHISKQGLHEPGDSLLDDSYPTTVKRLLSTGILEGAKVKYISSSGELIGIVKDCGYLCGCATCNFSSILRAHEFEEHAGGKTKHPNNHIYLENGKPIYNVVQAMKTAPFSIVDETIRNVAGSSVNEEFLQVWKGNLQGNKDRAKTDNNYHTKIRNLHHSTTRPRSYTPSTTIETKRSAEGGHKKRDNDLHRLLFMPNGLPERTELAYYARGKKILEGYKQGTGIVCSHCDTEIRPSQFEAHAGWAAKRQPYRHIYISDGHTLHDIAMMLANGQSITPIHVRLAKIKEN